jgi:hypothetical protein
VGHRVLTVFRAGFAAQWGAGVWPAAPIVSHGTVAAVLCGLASGALPPFAYAIFALCVSGALLALPFLGDFGALLRSDPAAEWVETLPVSRFELRLARTLLILFSVGVLSLAALLPAAWFAPDDAGWSGKALLVLAGLAQGLAIVAFLVALQSALGDRAEGLLVLAQTLLFTGIALGLVVGLALGPADRAPRGPRRRILLAGAAPARLVRVVARSRRARAALAVAPPAGDRRPRLARGPRPVPAAARRPRAFHRRLAVDAARAAARARDARLARAGRARELRPRLRRAPARARVRAAHRTR